MIVRTFKVLLNRRQRWQVLVVFVGMILAAGLELIGIGLIPAFVALLTNPEQLYGMLPDDAAGDFIRGMSPQTLILAAAATLAIVFLIKNLYLAGLLYVESKFLRSVTISTSSRLFRAYVLSPYTFHLQRNTAHLVRNILQETSNTVATVRNLLLVLREGLVLIVIFLLLLAVEPWVSTAVFVLLGSTAGFFYAVIRVAAKTQGRLAQAELGRQVQIVNQSVGAIKDAKVLNREPFLIGLFDLATRNREWHELHRRVVSSLPRLILEVIAIGAVLLVAIVFVLLDRPIESVVPALTLIAVAILRMTPAFISLTSSLSSIRYSGPSVDLVCTELETLEPNIQKLAKRRQDAPRLSSSVVLDAVSYRYPGGASSVLHSISLEIARGESIAVVGTSGAGKSTLINIILGLLQPTLGRVIVDGRNIQDDLQSWQTQIGYIPQEIYLLDDTVRRNIAFGIADEQIDEVAIESALKAARAAEFVAALPNGVNTFVGDRGVRLSGGQRQRIGIARALYHNPSVLVMDEATNALDDRTESEIVAEIEAMRGEHTIIVIAHRLSTVQGCDRLYLLEDGRIEAKGTFAEVMEARKPDHRLGNKFARKS